MTRIRRYATALSILLSVSSTAAAQQTTESATPPPSDTVETPDAQEATAAKAPGRRDGPRRFNVQSLSHSNTAAPNMVNGVNANSLADIGFGFQQLVGEPLLARAARARRASRPEQLSLVAPPQRDVGEGRLPADRPVGAGWFITPNVLAKAEYVDQKYFGYPTTNGKNGGHFKGHHLRSQRRALVRCAGVPLDAPPEGKRDLSLVPCPFFRLASVGALAGRSDRSHVGTRLMAQ